MSTEVFKPKRPNCGHLRYVLTGFRPVEMGHIARQNDDGSGRICLQLFCIELVAQAYVSEVASATGIKPAVRSTAAGVSFLCSRSSCVTDLVPRSGMVWFSYQQEFL
jgi:hypothetical protein